MLFGGPVFRLLGLPLLVYHVLGYCELAEW